MLFRLALIQLLGLFAARGANLVLPPSPTSEERDFGVSLTAALSSGNVAQLAALHYCEADEPWAVEWYFERLLRKPCTEIRLERVDPAKAWAYQEIEKESRPSLPMRWVVLLIQPPLLYEATYTVTNFVSAGWWDGRIVMTRRMAVFTPYQKQLVLAGSIACALGALWYLLYFLRARRRSQEVLRYAPLGLSLLLTLTALEMAAVLLAMPVLIRHPLWLPMPVLAGVLACLAASKYDDNRKAGPIPAKPGPLTGLRNAWRLRTGPFARPATRTAIVLLALCASAFLAQNLWRGLTISLNPQHVQGVVTSVTHRGSIHYSYIVAGHEYSSTGRGDTDRYYPVGSPVDVKYAASHPAFSTIDGDPFIFLEQLACAGAFFGGIFWLRRVGRPKQAPQAHSAIPGAAQASSAPKRRDEFW